MAEPDLTSLSAEVASEGGEAGSLDVMLDRVADITDHQTDHQLDCLAAVERMA